MSSGLVLITIVDVSVFVGGTLYLSVGGPVQFVLCDPCTSDVMSAVLNMWLVYCLWVAAIFVEVCKFGNGTMTKGVESVM